MFGVTDAVSSVPDRIDIIDYSRQDRLNQLGATVIEGTCFLLAAFLTWRGAAAVLRASGDYWSWLLLGVVVWCSISFVRACQIVRPCAPSQQLRAAQQNLGGSSEGRRMSAAAERKTLADGPR